MDPRTRQHGRDTSDDRARIHLLADYIRIIGEHAYKKDHQLEKLVENLLLFAEVCPTLYFGNWRRQIENLAAYCRRKLLDQHLFLIEELMLILKQFRVVTDPSIFHKLANVLDQQEWKNEEDEVEKLTHHLRTEAKKQYDKVLPEYLKMLKKMYPNSNPESGEYYFRNLRVSDTDDVNKPPESPTPKVQQSHVRGRVDPSFNRAEMEKEFDARSRWVKPKPGPGTKKRTGVRGRGRQRTMVRPSYTVPLTQKALQKHFDIHQQDEYHRTNDEFWWPYQNTYRHPAFPGRRALSDSGFELEESRDHGHMGGPRRAHSDEGGPTYHLPDRNLRDFRDGGYSFAGNSHNSLPGPTFDRPGRNQQPYEQPYEPPHAAATSFDPPGSGSYEPRHKMHEPRPGHGPGPPMGSYQGPPAAYEPRAPNGPAYDRPGQNNPSYERIDRKPDYIRVYTPSPPKDNEPVFTLTDEGFQFDNGSKGAPRQDLWRAAFGNT